MSWFVQVRGQRCKLSPHYGGKNRRFHIVKNPPLTVPVNRVALGKVVAGGRRYPTG